MSGRTEPLENEDPNAAAARADDGGDALNDVVSIGFGESVVPGDETETKLQSQGEAASQIPLADASGPHEISSNKQKSKKGKGKGHNKQEVDNTDYEVAEHQMSLSALQTSLDTNLDTQNPKDSRGLSGSAAWVKLAEDGYNKLSPPPRQPEWVKFLLHLTNMFMIMLLGAALLSLVAFLINRTDKLNLYLCLVLVFIVLLNATIGYLQERHSGEVMGSFSRMMAQQCRVVRDGKQVRVPVEELVKGDVVLIQGGDRVPADLRIIHSNKLKVEASSVTGESAPIQCTVEATNEIPLHSRNLAFNSSLCVEGDAVGVVIRTGDDTMIGMVARLAGGESTVETTLQREINRFVKFIAALALTMAVVLFFVGIGRGFDVLDTFVLAFIAILVANIPQGLPATVTTALTIAAKKMQRRNVFVKRLDAVETLGAASVICSDKTGTLTQNQMTLQNFWFDGSFEMLDGGLILDTSNVDTSFSSQLVHVSRPVAKSLEYIIGKSDTNVAQNVPLPDVSFNIQGSELAETAQHWYGHHLEPMLLVSTVCNEAVFSSGGAETTACHRSRLSPSIHPVGNMKINRLPSTMSSLPHLGRGNSLTLPHRRERRKQQLTAMDLARRSESMRAFDKPVAEIAHPQEDSGDIPGAAAPHSCGDGENVGPQTVLGNASDAALLRYCDQIAPAEVVRKRYPVVAEVPFNSSNKWAMKIVRPPIEEDPKGKFYYVLLKGAPEIVLRKCTWYMTRRQEYIIDETFRDDFKVAYERFASQGQRVLGCAMTVVEKTDLPDVELITESQTLTGLTFVGLVSLMDPPREGVAEAIDSCFNAGIRAFMVTGDHAFTAEAIARRVGIINLPTKADLALARGVAASDIDPQDEEIGAAIVSGDQLYAMTEQDWQALLQYEQLVFARTTPTQKLEIVKRCQASGEVVAVTGDGVNDSPALKRADIGVAMGSADASDVAREAADIVLADDNFASIVSACEEGRVLFDNLKKTIAYTLTHLWPEIFPAILFLAFGFPLGLSSLQVLSIDLGTELLPAISLAYETAEDNIMDRPPRDMKKDRLVNRPMLIYSYAVVGVLESIICFVAYLFVFVDNGVNLADLPFSSGDHWKDDANLLFSGGNMFNADDQVRIVEEARSAWYINLILCQLFHIWFVRSRFVSIQDRCKEVNGVMVAGASLAVALMIIFVYVPFIQPIFTTHEVGFVMWLPSLIFGAFISLLSEGCKYRSRRGKEICKFMVRAFVF